MPQKLSPYKISKMMALYFDGYSQSEIANKLKIDQSTVSLQVSKFRSLAEQQGAKAAGEEFGIMDQIESLHSLASELKKEQLTVEEAKVGLKMVSALQKLGVKAEDYQDVIQAATKLKSEGFLESAVELNKLEKSSGMSHEEIVAQAAGASQQLEQAQAQLQNVTGKLNESKEELVTIDKQKKLASQDFEAHMQQIDVDINRLALVEKLASALKKAGVSNEDLKDYIKRQQQLKEAGIGIENFISILEKVKVVTYKDHGKALFQALVEYGGLSEANQALELKIGSLEKEVAGLEKQAKLKGEIEAEIAALKAEKASLEPYMSKLHDQKELLEKVKSEVSSLTRNRAGLVQEIAGLATYKGSLSDEIKSLEQTTSDLEERKSEYDAVSASLSETKAKLNQETRRLEIFESFLGLVQSSSIPQLENFIKGLPYQLGLIKAGKHSPELLRNMIIENLTGGTLQVLRCSSCKVKFVVDKQPLTLRDDYYCPLCGMTYPVKVDKDALVILKTELFNLKNPHFEVKMISPGLKSPKQKNDDSK